MDIESLMNNVGAMAEVSALFYTTLVKNGVPDGMALSMTLSFIVRIMK